MTTLDSILSPDDLYDALSNGGLYLSMPELYEVLSKLDPVSYVLQGSNGEKVNSLSEATEVLLRPRTLITREPSQQTSQPQVTHVSYQETP